MRATGRLGGTAVIAAALVVVAGPPAAAGGIAAADVRLVLDQAEAALAILEARAAGRAPDPDAWTRLWESEGFVRLRERQESFGATGVDEGLRAYLEDPETAAGYDELRRAVDGWRSLDVQGLGERALDYLPAATALRATLYPVIKRATNSFVWELDTDPAIFAHVDPSRSAASIANTMVHELHHVGAASCSEPAGRDGLAPGARDALDWASGFSEGLATLAAAGSPDVHPHATSPGPEWVVWERDVARFADDLRALDDFFLGLVDQRWDADRRRELGFPFVNTDDVPQGAFYTVGWKMAALVERALGRDVVVRSVCDPRVLLMAYDRIAAGTPRADADPLPRWSARLIEAIHAGDADG